MSCTIVMKLLNEFKKMWAAYCLNRPPTPRSRLRITSPCKSVDKLIIVMKK
jgi:hypothetical protein